METGARVQQIEGGFAGELGRLVTQAPHQAFPGGAGPLAGLLLQPRGWGRGAPILVHEFSQGVYGGTVDCPLCDAHLAQVGTRVTGETFTVFKVFPTELTADLLHWFTCRRDGK